MAYPDVIPIHGIFPLNTTKSLEMVTPSGDFRASASQKIIVPVPLTMELYIIDHSTRAFLAAVVYC